MMASVSSSLRCFNTEQPPTSVSAKRAEGNESDSVEEGHREDQKCCDHCMCCISHLAEDRVKHFLVVQEYLQEEWPTAKTNSCLGTAHFLELAKIRNRTSLHWLFCIGPIYLHFFRWCFSIGRQKFDLELSRSHSLLREHCTRMERKQAFQPISGNWNSSV